MNMHGHQQRQKNILRIFTKFPKNKKPTAEDILDNDFPGLVIYFYMKLMLCMKKS